MSHIHDLIDFAVAIFIVNNDRVLLINHRQLNKWLPVGGHIELNEDPDEALFREVKEECGLEVEVINDKPVVEAEGTKSLYTPFFLNIHKISDTHRHVGLVYFAKAKSDKFLFNKEERKDIRWFSKADLEKPEFNVGADVKFYANEALITVKSKP